MAGKWAIIKNKSTGVKTIRLTDWESYEWEDFNILKNNEQILWFDNDSEAVAFVIKHFRMPDISEEVLLKCKLPSGGNWEFSRQG